MRRREAMTTVGVKAARTAPAGSTRTGRAVGGYRRTLAGRALAGLAVAGLAVGAVACSGTDTATGAKASVPGTTALGYNQPTNPFYQPPVPLPAGKPGDVIRAEPIPGSPAGSQAWRVLYHSTGVNGGDIAVSGVVIAPVGAGATSGTTGGPTATTGGTGQKRPVVTWAHPTTGVEDPCAPSYSSLVFELIPNLEAMLKAGYVVAATDYEGLGTPGVHPYLVGESEGRSVLDAARAAAKLPDAGAGSTVIPWGWSQGGQAALFAGQMAADYAPELRLAGVAAAAPAGELTKIISADINTVDGVALGGYGLNAFADVYASTYPGLKADALLTPAGQQALPKIVGLCNITQASQMEALVNPLIGKFYSADPATTSPWSDIFTANTPGAQRTPVPIFIVQGTADVVVPPASTADLTKALCAKGDKVALVPVEGASHTTVAFQAAPQVDTFMADVLAGTTPPGLCAS